MSNWRSLPISERYNTWKLYREAYPEMSHRDMIKHFDDGGTIGWPPDDPPKGSGTTIKGIETFGDREKKSYMDSLLAYNSTKDYTKVYANYEDNKRNIWLKYKKLNAINRTNNYNNTNLFNSTFMKNNENYTNEMINEENKLQAYLNNVVPPSSKNMNQDKVPLKQYTRSGSERSDTPEYKQWQQNYEAGKLDPTVFAMIYKKPTGNGLIPQLSKVPIIQPETQTSYIKFRPPTPLPEGNVELQSTGFANVGVRKKPDGTRFIYDRSGKTDKTVTIDDNRIGFDYYIKKLYEE